MVVDDKVFGSLEFDYTWRRREKVTFCSKESDIILIVSGDEDAKFLPEQYEAYKSLKEKWDGLQYLFLQAVYEFYLHLREELGYDVEPNELYPEVSSAEDMLGYIELVGIKIHEPYVRGRRYVGISFDCSWDAENGVGIRMVNDIIIKVGYQDIAI